MRTRSVPVILQGSNVECAAACLSMIAAYHGHHLPVNQARDRCGIGRNGATAGAIARAARGLGFEVKAYRTAPGSLGQLTLPAIAHWGGDHFVVVTGTSRGRVQLIDPGFGRRSMSVEAFEAEVGKVILTLAPGPDFEPTRRQEPAFWRRYVGALLRVRGAGHPLAQVLGTSLVIQLLGLALPLLAGVVVDRVVPTGTMSVLTLLGIGILVLFAAHLITSYLRAALIIYLQGRLDTQAMIGFCAHLLRLPLRYFEQRSTGDIVLRVSSIAMLRELLTTQTLTSVLDLFLVVSYLAIMATQDVTVTLVMVGVVVAQVLLLVVTMPLARERMAADLAAQARAHGYIVETLEGIATLKASATERAALDGWSELYFGWMRTTLRRTQLVAVLDIVSGALRTLTPMVVLWIGTARVLGGDLSIGTALALTWLAAAIVTPLSVLTGNGQRLQLAGAQLQRLADVLDTPPEYPAAGASADRPDPSANGSTPAKLRGRIELDHVGFRYDAYSPPVMSDITVTIEPGTRVAIVGATGAGKTTLAMLLLGLYRPTEGAVRIDGVDMAGPNPDVVRRQTGTVLQEPFVFAGTIHDNIAFRDPSISAEQVRRAARLAALDEEIAELPQGYETRLAERGAGLSGGQRQRLALARALARDPALLLLDEATSHLDAVTEATIHGRLATVRCTQVLIAHRLSTVRDADLILVLHRGRLVEHGTHDDMLLRGGQYAALVGAQLNGHRGAPPRGGPDIVAPNGAAAPGDIPLATEGRR